MEVFKKSFQIGLVLILSLFIVNCSSKNRQADDGDSQLTGAHTYDIKFTTEDGETIHYTGSVSDNEDVINLFTKSRSADGGNAGFISLYIEDDPLTIDGKFFIDENNEPETFDPHPVSGVYYSYLYISDSNKGFALYSRTGRPVISNLEKRQSIENDDFEVNEISYTFKFDGTLELEDSDDNTYLVTASVKVNMNPERE